MTMSSLDEASDFKHRLSKPKLAFLGVLKFSRDALMRKGPAARGIEEYVSLMQNLLKTSGIYALGSVTLPFISLILAPFLTHNLSRSDYGALVVLTTAITLLAGATQLGLGSAFFRSYSYDYKSQHDQMGVLSTVVILLMLTSMTVAIAIVFAAPWLTAFVLQDPSLSNPVRLAALIVLLLNLTVPGFAFLRAENRAGFFVILSIASLLITLGATIILVGRLHMGIVGSLIATGGGYAFVVACTLPPILVRAGVRLRFDIAWGLLTFGFPNVFNFLSMWVLQLSDRFLLAHFGSLAQTASYAVAYNLGGGIGVVILSPFLLAWPSFVFATAKRTDAQYIFQLVFRWFSSILLFTTYALSLVGIALLDMFFPTAYHSATYIIPIVSVSVMFYGIYNIVGLGIGLRRKNWLAVVFTTTAALVNIGINIVLIPRYGAMGAAVSTLIAYIVLVFIAYIVSQHIYTIPFEIGLFLLTLLVGTVLYIGSVFLGRGLGMYAALSIFIGTLALYGGCLVLLVMLQTQRRKYQSPQKQKDPIP